MGPATSIRYGEKYHDKLNRTSPLAGNDLEHGKEKEIWIDTDKQVCKFDHNDIGFGVLYINYAGMRDVILSVRRLCLFLLPMWDRLLLSHSHFC